jgi:hypothetical protein
MGSKIGSRAIRITVEDAATHPVIVDILTEALRDLREETGVNPDWSG